MGDVKCSCLLNNARHVFVWLVHHKVCHHIIVATLTSASPYTKRGWGAKRSRQLCKTLCGLPHSLSGQLLLQFPVPECCYLECFLVPHLHLALFQCHSSRRKNIARGTTDPGYWVYNLNHFSDWNQFESISDEKIYSWFEPNILDLLCPCQFFAPTFFQLFLNRSMTWM